MTTKTKPADYNVNIFKSKKRFEKRLRPIALLGSVALVMPMCLLIANMTIRSKSASYSSSHRLPNVILWSWERPDDLSFLDAKWFGIAYLASQLRLQGDNVIIRPRFQPLKLPKNASLIAVVRIESDRSFAPSLSPDQQAKVSSEIKKIASTNNIAAVQIDFDAKQSERDFYRGLLTDLRRAWPSGVDLTITALASWCTSDPWIRDLPIDDAIPMLFRMGVDDNQIRMNLRADRDFSLDICRNSVGVSSDEPVKYLPSGRRVYVFSPRVWSQDSFEKAVSGLSDDNPR